MTVPFSLGLPTRTGRFLFLPVPAKLLLYLMPCVLFDSLSQNPYNKVIPTNANYPIARRGVLMYNKAVKNPCGEGRERMVGMNIVCLDMEGVLVPEIWIAFSEESGIPELRRTTRDEPDYDKLMQYRLGILKEHGLGLREIQATIAKIDPMPGAKAFLDELRSLTQVLILSDTFEQFARPLMEKLNWPTIFCNTLEVAESGEITGYHMRCQKSKLTTVKALQSIGYDTIAAGDSYNDLAMIQAGKAGFLFKSTDKIKADFPEIPAYEDFGDLLNAIKAVL